MPVDIETGVTAEPVLFEPETFEFADERVTLTGRWFGVRGRRFVRPTLTLISEAERVRALAGLEHKPWSAEDGEPWTAVFPCERSGDDVTEVELAVAPDIAVMLAPPSGLPRHARGGRLRRRRGAVSAHGAPLPAPDSALPLLRKENQELRAAADRQRAQIEQLQEQVMRGELTRAEMRGAVARRDAAVAKLDAVLLERDAAIHERDAAVRARDAAIHERDAAVRARDAAIHERDAAVRVRDAAIDERDAAVRARDAAIRERDAAVRDRDVASRARDSALRECERIRLSTSMRAAAPVPDPARVREPGALPDRAPVPDRAPAPERAPVPDRTANHAGRLVHPLPPPPPRAARERTRSAHPWLTRAIALTVLLAALLALVIVLQST